MNSKAGKEAAVFFVTVLTLSFMVFWGPIAYFKIPTVNLVSGGMGPAWAIILFIIGGFVPSAVGIILTRIYEGRDGIRDLFRSSLQWRIGGKWFGIMLLLAVYWAFSLIALNALLGGTFDFSLFWLQLPSLLPLIVLGPLSEEYGWRGFAIKRMLKVTNPNLASLVIGLIWSLWHLPLFHMLGSSQYELGMPFIAFMFSVTSSSFAYTYIYLRTKYSTFSAIFLHWINTYAIQVVSTGVQRSWLYNWLEIVPVLAAGLVFMVLLNKEKKSSSVSTTS